MKRFAVSLLAALILVSMILAGCTTSPNAPHVQSAAPQKFQELKDKGLIAPYLELNPYEGLAIKPDGKPYNFTHTTLLLGHEWCVVAEEILESLMTRAGAGYTGFDPNFDVNRQIAFIEDHLAVAQTDAFLIIPVDAAALVPSVNKSRAAGIPVFSWGFCIPSDSVVTCSWHDPDGQFGSNMIGQYFVELAESLGQEINIYEVWGSRSNTDSVEHHNGFNRPLSNHPLITVTESPDTGWSNEVAARFVMDSFSAHPELNAIYIHGGGSTGGGASTGCIEGLRAAGRLLPSGDPKHVWVATNDTDSIAVQALDDGHIDAIGLHGPWDLIDVIVKAVFTYVILGQPVDNSYSLPVYVITRENIDTKLLYGATACWPRMPIGEWDLWPVLDTSELGLETPTVELRAKHRGY